MKRTNFLTGLLICLLLAAATVSAQTAKRPDSPKTDSDKETLSINVDLVNVLFTVADRNGRFITNLQKDDLKVLEDEKQQTISNFSNETNLPLSIALVFDTSASVLGRLQFEQEAASQFFYTTLRRSTDKATVIAFDKTVVVAQDFTDNTELLTKAIGKIHASGSTSLFDAVYLAMTQKLVGQPGRHVLVIISDGEDNSSERSIDEAIEMAQKTDTVIYAVSTNSTELFGSDRDRGNKFLKRLSEETGGRVFLPIKSEDLTKSFLQISEELRSQYTLAYRSTNTKTDGAYRKIRLALSNKQYKVRARDGYFAAKAAKDNPR
jgi:Ca-activated chloride channel family protein